MASEFDEFIQDEQGNILLYPIIGMAAFTAFDTGIGLKLDFALGETEQGPARSAVQVALSAEQARELGEMLLRKADQVSLPPPTGTPQN